MSDERKVGVAVYCTYCKRRKAPIGRSISPAMIGTFCDFDCPGYDKAPLPSQLWPGEKLEDL